MLTASVLLTATLVAAQPPSPPRPIQTPVCKDAALEIKLFAKEPDIVTPTGVAVAADDAILVCENHTHFPLKDYKGPKFDRILRFVDKDGDAKPDSRGVFADNLKDTMGIGAHPDGSIWVACRHAIYRFTDANGDGVADKKETLIRLETKGDYPHNGLCGFAIEPTNFGDVYFGLGENFGEPYKIVGSDGSFVTGGGEGGSVYRCRYDGSKVERFATGFWNPYHGCLDGYGRLFICDNDPDDRPPCRLHHIVLGGDYGYRFRNGRRGIHPFTSWNGELPGTLPMVAATGEAPSGLVHIASDAVGEHNRDVLIGTSWGDHRLERFRLQPRGASFHSQPEPIVVGNEDFRPVGVAMDKFGSLWVTDWVDKSYNVHGKGRIWRVRKKGDSSLRPSVEKRPYQKLLDNLRSDTDVALTQETMKTLEGTASQTSLASALIRIVRTNALPDDFLMQLTHPRMPAEVRAEGLRRMTRGTAPAAVLSLKSSASDDPYLDQAVLVGLARILTPEHVKSLMETFFPAKNRLAGVLIHRMQDPTKNSDWLIPRFSDSDPTVQFAAIQTVGEHRIQSLRFHIVKLLESGQATGRLLLACTAALDDLDRVKKHHGDEFVAGDVLIQFILKPNATPPFIREALAFVPPNHPQLKTDFLQRLLQSKDEGVRRAAIQTLRDRPSVESQRHLRSVVTGKDLTDLQLEAVVGLSAEDAESRKVLLTAVGGNDERLRREALRSLRNGRLNSEEIERLQQASAGDAASLEQIARLRQQKPTRPKPTESASWMKLLVDKADADAGRRIFFHPQGPGCFKCHRVGDRGGQAGPDLSAAGGAMTRERILESILQPNKEVAPMFTAWTLLMTDGTTKTGLFVGGTNQNSQVYVDSAGQRFEVKPEDVENRKPATASIMPAELVDAMTDQELRDLLAYLEAVKKK